MRPWCFRFEGTEHRGSIDASKACGQDRHGGAIVGVAWVVIALVEGADGELDCVLHAQASVVGPASQNGKDVTIDVEPVDHNESPAT